MYSWGPTCFTPNLLSTLLLNTKQNNAKGLKRSGQQDKYSWEIHYFPTDLFLTLHSIRIISCWQQINGKQMDGKLLLLVLFTWNLLPKIAFRNASSCKAIFNKLSKLSWWLRNNHTYNLVCLSSAAFYLAGEWLLQKCWGFSVLFKLTEHCEGKTKHTKILLTYFFSLKKLYFNRWRKKLLPCLVFRVTRQLRLGASSGGHLVQPCYSSRATWSQLPRTMTGQLLSISMDGDFTTSWATCSTAQPSSRRKSIPKYYIQHLWYSHF